MRNQGFTLVELIIVTFGACLYDREEPARDRRRQGLYLVMPV